MEPSPNFLSEYAAWAAENHLLPVKVTPFYQRKVEEELKVLGRSGGPLFRAVYPAADRIVPAAPGESADAVGDRVCMPENLRGIAIRKYQDRILFFPTVRCAAHCQYCFRQDLLSAELADSTAALDQKLSALTGYLKLHPEIREVILSGGDPLMLSHDDLAKVLRILREDLGREVRIHTRITVFAPSVLSPEKIELLRQANVRLVSHIVHPYEICDEVESLFAELRKSEIRLYNQFPMLRKINDHALVLRALLERLDQLGVRNLSIFIPDAARYSVPFRLNLARFLGIIDELGAIAPSWIDIGRITVDSPHGKFGREDLVHYDPESSLAIFRRGEKEFRYPDISLDEDAPGDLSQLLWRGTLSQDLTPVATKTA